MLMLNALATSPPIAALVCAQQEKAQPTHSQFPIKMMQYQHTWHWWIFFRYLTPRALELPHSLPVRGLMMCMMERRVETQPPQPKQDIDLRNKEVSPLSVNPDLRPTCSCYLSSSATPEKDLVQCMVAACRCVCVRE